MAPLLHDIVVSVPDGDGGLSFIIDHQRGGVLDIKLDPVLQVGTFGVAGIGIIDTVKKTGIHGTGENLSDVVIGFYAEVLGTGLIIGEVGGLRRRIHGSN